MNNDNGSPETRVKCSALTVDLGDALKAALAALAERNDRSMGAEARIAIAAHVKAASAREPTTADTECTTRQGDA